MTQQELLGYLNAGADLSPLTQQEQELILKARKEINFLYTEDDGHTEEQKAQEQVVIESATLSTINNLGA
jgi:hypothetical protein